jgi:hypothetical protein
LRSRRIRGGALSGRSVLVPPLDPVAGKLDQSAKTRAGEAAEIQQACGTP